MCKLSHKTPIGFTVTSVCPLNLFLLKLFYSNRMLQGSPIEMNEVPGGDIIQCECGYQGMLLRAEHVTLQYLSFFCVVPYMNDYLDALTFWHHTGKEFLGSSQFMNDFCNTCLRSNLICSQALLSFKKHICSAVFTNQHGITFFFSLFFFSEI